jgi:hypothetical protein
MTEFVHPTSLHRTVIIPIKLIRLTKESKQVVSLFFDNKVQNCIFSLRCVTSIKIGSATIKFNKMNKISQIYRKGERGMFVNLNKWSVAINSPRSLKIKTLKRCVIQKNINFLIFTFKTKTKFSQPMSQKLEML